MWNTPTFPTHSYSPFPEAVASLPDRRKAGPVRPPSKAQQLAQALQERLLFVDAQLQPGPDSRAYVPAYGDPPDHLPTVLCRFDPASHRRSEALLKIREFVVLSRSIGNAGLLAFMPKQLWWKVTKLGAALLDVLGDLYQLAICRRPDRHFDPYVHLAIEEFAACGLIDAIYRNMNPEPNLPLWRAGQIDPVVANLGNTYVGKLGKRANQNHTGRIEQLHRSRCDRATEDVRDYVSDLHKQHPLAHIERQELSVQGDYLVARPDGFKSLVTASTRLLRELKQRFGEAIVADIRKVDSGPNGNYVVHLLLAVDGPDASELAILRRVMRELWNAMFPNRGIVVNCNDFEQLMYRGCGAVIRQHESLAGQLNKAVVFLAETDRMIRIGFGGNDDGLLIGTVSGRSQS